MDPEKYRKVYSELNKLSDVEKLHRTYGVSPKTLEVLLGQKLVRKTKRNYYRIKKQSASLAGRWAKGHSFLDMAQKLNFSPVLVASFVLGERGIPRKQFRAYLNDPEAIKDHRLRKEISDAVDHELIYAPKNTVEQRSRGEMVERKIGEWLTKRKIRFLTENEAKGKYRKTPDFLLEKNMDLDGKKIRWIECKATFGDEEEIKKDFKKQLSHYLELFGKGVVVYWYGYLKGKELDNIYIKSKSHFY